jgi:hypothetical protein
VVAFGASFVPAIFWLLAIASLLRIVLVVQGGQLYWPDERLYTQVLDIFDLHRGHSFDIVKALLSTQDHLGFALIAAVPASIQFALGHALSRSGNGLMLLPGVVLAQASVAAIGLVYAIARRAGRDTREALAAACLMTAATTMFYYARHLLPYDSALALGLLAVWCGLGSTRRDSLACGAAAAAAFITYNGYWLLAGTALLLHVAREGRTTTGGAVGRGIVAGAGFALVPALIVLAEFATGAPLMFAGMRRLAGTVTDGYAPEGFTLPFAYIWHAEHGLLLLWIAAAMLVALDRGVWSPGRRRTAATWLFAATFIFLALGFSSAVFHVFVVMGRQARQVVPFLCLASAAAVAEQLERRRAMTWLVGTCVVVVGAQAAWNFRVPLQQRFPRDVIDEVVAKYGPVDFDNTLEGPPLTHAHVDSRFVLLNAQHLYHPRAPRAVRIGGAAGSVASDTQPAANELMRFPHPLQFLPYQYEGLDPVERQVLRGNDIAMRLVDTGVAPGRDQLP